MSSQISNSGWHRHMWAIPAALTAAAISLLCWGAWVYGYHPNWLSGAYSRWRPVMDTNQSWTLVATIALLLASLGCYWWPRRRDRIPIALITVVVLVLVAATLGTASYVPCRGDMSTAGVTFWIFQLYVGQPPNMVYQSVLAPAARCVGPPPLALQLGQMIGLGATGLGAIVFASVLWRKPLDRLQSRFARDVTIFTGLSPLTIPLLRRLVEGARSPRAIVVIEPDENNPLLEEARLTGARVVIDQPDSPYVLQPIISALRGCALTRLYALSGRDADNEAVIEQAARILGRCRANPNRQPHLVALINDPRRADLWRGDHSGNWDAWFEDALNSAECTARGLVAQVLRRQPRHLLVCGDGPLTVPILVELARQAWERAELLKAANAGRDMTPDVATPDAPAPWPVERVTLLDRRSRDIKREYRMSARSAVLDSIPDIDAQQVPWREDLLRRLDAMDPARAYETAVIIAESPPGSGVHEAGRVARLHRKVPVFVLAAAGRDSGGPVFNLLHPFELGLLVNGEVPEDTWTRVARHWHECYRLRYPLPPGHPKADARLPWSDLAAFLQQDNILQIRSILTEVANRGRQWKPVHQVPEGSVVELTESDLTEVAKAEHARWVKHQLAAGRAGGNVVPWAEYSPRMRSRVTEDLRLQLGQLEDMGFVPVIPADGPPTAAAFERLGLVRATRLSGPLTWMNHAGEELRGSAGDWRVIDDEGRVRTVTDPEFRSSHELVGDDLWRRVGTYRAWQVSEAAVVRTKEGKSTARPGDWIVEAPSGERWPVSDEQFLWSYQPSPPGLPAQPDRETAPEAPAAADTIS